MSLPRLSPCLIAFAALGLAACAEDLNRAYGGRVPFDDDFVDQPGSSVTAAKSRLQYYLSSDVVLSVNHGVAPHVTSHGRQAPPPPDEIRLPSGSTGRALASGDGWIAVTFSDGVYLYFASASAPRNRRMVPGRAVDRYYLYTSDSPHSVPQVRIGDKVYDAMGSTASTFLLVDAEALETPQRESVPTGTLPDDWLSERPH